MALRDEFITAFLEMIAFSSRQTPSEVQWCLDSMLSAKEFSPYRMGFGSNPVDFFGRGGDNGDLLFSHDTSLADSLRNNGNFARELRKRLLTKRPTANRAVFFSTINHLTARISPFGAPTPLTEPQKLLAVAGFRENTGH